MNDQGIVLIGLKHCGKSSVARALGENLRWPYYDTDRLLENHHVAQYHKHLSIREIYNALGKERFDWLQIFTLKQFFNRHGSHSFLLALGGGVGDLDKIGHLLNQTNCIVVLLEEDFSLMFERIFSNGLPPFLQEETANNSANTGIEEQREAAFTKFCSLSEPRLQRYHSWADMNIFCGGRSPSDIALELLDKLKDWGY